jgi:hypothetical protein
MEALLSRHPGRRHLETEDVNAPVNGRELAEAPKCSGGSMHLF